MLTLGTRGLPASRAELELAVREGLALFRSPKLSVEVTGEFPALEKISLDLSGGAVPQTIPASDEAGENVRELSVGTFDLKAHPLFFETARAQVRLSASDVRLVLRGGKGTRPALLDLASARTGDFVFEIARAELETVILVMAQRAARPHGVTIERTTLNVESTGPRSVRFCADVLAQKLFMHTALTLRGTLTVDDALDAKLSGLQCSGGGIIGSLASNFLQPYITQIESRPIPLASFALRGVRVRDVSLETGEPLRVRASFGS